MRFVWVILSALLTAAHFLRSGPPGAVLACLLVSALPFIKKRWTVPVIQAALVFFFLNAVDTLVSLVRVRQMTGAPWLRLTLIMGAVSAVHLIGVGWFFKKSVRARYPASDFPWFPSAVAFFLTFGLLAIVSLKAPRGMLLLSRFVPGGEWVEGFLLALYAAFVTEKMSDEKQQLVWRRRIWTLFTVVFFAQLFLGLLGFEKLLMTGKLHLPVPAIIAAGPVFRGDGFFMLILFGATLLLVGPAWCSHLCYIGALDNLFADRRRRPVSLAPWTNAVRPTILALVLGAALLLRLFGASSTVAAGMGLGFGVLGVAVMFFLSRRLGTMVHCTVYCPMGLFANLFGKISPFRIRIDSGCNQCGACSLACRYDALSSRDIASRKPALTCTLCGDCVQKCGDAQIGYRFGRWKNSKVRASFIVIAVSLQAVFLGVARL